MSKEIILYCPPDLLARAQDLTRNMPKLPIIIHDGTTVLPDNYFYLRHDGLWLYTPQFLPLNFHWFYQDFINKRKAVINKDLLARTAHIKHDNNKQLLALDLTAGLGRDSIILALSGYKVTMVENNPYLAIILGYLCTEFADQLPKMSIIHTDYNSFLLTTGQLYDLIYLDPMFNDGKMALAKKGMQIIQLLIASCNSHDNHAILMDDYAANRQLFNLCQKHCHHKMVVKRDNKQGALFITPPSTYRIKGKTVRFDVYTISL